MKQKQLLISAALLSGTAFASSMDHTITLNNVSIRAGSTSNITLNVFVNEKRPCHNKNVLAVHGLAHTGATWENFANALFADTSSKTDVCRVYAINFPARGGSSAPSGSLTMGELGLEDNSRILQRVLRRLHQDGTSFKSLVAHSAGANEVELLQERLKSNGTNLEKRFGIRQVIFLAPSGSGNFVPPDNGTGAGLIAPFITSDPLLGDVVAVPDFVFPFFFFANLMGVVDPAAPSDAEITAKGYNAAESLRLTRQILNIAPEQLPVIAAGLFANKKDPQLTVIGGSNDPFVPSVLAQAEYQLNTGDSQDKRLRIIDGEFAVHSLYITNPALIISNLPAGTKF
jgi:pimeloyl-ACP methyl ester carboxylesterase